MSSDPLFGHIQRALDAIFPVETPRPALDSAGHKQQPSQSAEGTRRITLTDYTVLECDVFEISPDDWVAKDSNRDDRSAYGTTSQDAVDMLFEMAERDIELDERDRDELSEPYDREAAELERVDSMDAEDFSS